MSNKPARGLGKGLSAILGEAGDLSSQRPAVTYVNKSVSGPVAELAETRRIPLDRIVPNPFQPRDSFDSDALDELTASIRSLGVIQPITVRRKDDGNFQIISGERRFRASRAAGLDTIPAYIVDTDDRGMLEMAIVENVQREDLDPIEVAMGYRRLIEECDLTQEQLSERIGSKRSTIANTLRLLSLPVKVQHDLKVGLITAGHAKVLLGAGSSDRQERLCDAVIRNGLSVRALEDRIRREDRVSAPAGEQPELPEVCYKVLERVGRYFDGGISIKRSPSGKGTLTIRFSDNEQLRDFLSAFEERQ